MLTPTLEGFRKACAGGGKVPLRRKIPADLDTPVSAYLKLESMGAVFLLESVEQGTQLGRYSFIGISPYASVKLQDGTVETRRCGRVEARPLDPAHPFAPVREALAAAGRRTLLIDADLGLANIDVIMNVDTSLNLAHVVAGRRRLEQIIQPGPGGTHVVCGASGLTVSPFQGLTPGG